MDVWIRLFKESAIKPEDLDGQLGATPEEVKEAIEVFPMRINSYFLDLMKEKGDTQLLRDCNRTIRTFIVDKNYLISSVFWNIAVG